MGRAATPFSPSAEIAAYRQARSGPAAHGPLSPDVLAFCQSAVAVILGVRDPVDGPIAGLGLALHPLSDGRLRLLLRRGGHDRLLLALMRDGRIAATFSNPTSHRSVQIKGSEAVIGAVRDEDLRAVARQTRAFERDLIDNGYPPSFCAAFNVYDAADLVAVEFTPAAVFTQTPGPGAGAELTT